MIEVSPGYYVIWNPLSWVVAKMLGVVIVFHLCETGFHHAYTVRLPNYGGW